MNAAALVLIALSVFSISYEIRKGTKMATQAVAALLAAVALVGKEVGETADAIRNHVNSDSGISADVLLAAADKLTAAAGQLDELQAGLAGDTGSSDTPASDVPADGSDQGGDTGSSDAPASDVPASDAPAVDPAVSGDTGGSGNDSTFGNQNGVGSDFETGEPNEEPSESNQVDEPASDAPASDVPADQPGGQSDQ
jgi:hypothetical protein